MRKAYNTLLSAAVDPIPVYYQNAPDDIADKVYIVFDSVSNNDRSTLTCQELECSMRITVHSFDTKYNDEVARDQAADLILRNLYATPLNALGADGVQVLSTRLTSDQSLPYNLNNTRNYSDRVLIFNHKVYIKN